MLQHNPDTPLFQAATVECWLAQTWSEPVRPHTPAWTLATNGNVAARDLLAMILAVWVDKSIQHPPRYLSWLLQRWLDQPDSPPVEHWTQFQTLAALPIGQWFEQGRQVWLELAPQGHRALPFGLDDLHREDEDEQPDEADEGLLAGEPLLSLPVRSTSEPSAPQTAEDIWLATTNKLSVKLTRSAYHNWIRGTEAVAYADGVLTVNAKHPIVRDWLTERLNPSIEQTASAVAQRPVRIRYTADPDSSSTAR